ncbi:hypothetical protein, partial [Thauera sinica]
ELASINADHRSVADNTPVLTSGINQDDVNRQTMLNNWHYGQSTNLSLPLAATASVVYAPEVLAAMGLGKMAAGGAIGGGFDAAGQAYKLYTGTQDEYRLAQTVIASGTGALTAPLVSGAILGNALLGGAVGGTNTAITNWWYGENVQVTNAALDGLLFSGAGTAFGRLVTGQLQKRLPLFVGEKPYDPTIPILLQNVKPNSYPGYVGSAVEQGVSNIPSFRESAEGGEK